MSGAVVFGSPPLLLVRHAEAGHLVQDLTGGWTDSDLTEKGIRQSDLLAERIGREMAGRPLLLGCSPLRRAVATAARIGQAIQLEPEVFPELIDLNNGIAAGKTRAEAAHLSLPLTVPVEDWRPFPQAETWQEFFQRVSEFMGRFYTHLPAPAVLVTHAAVLHVIVAWWLRLEVTSRTSFDFSPGSLTLLRVNDWSERTIERLNDTAHLHPSGLTGPLIFQ